MAFWGTEVKPGKSFTHTIAQACGRLRISQATLGFGSSTKKSVVQCNVGKKSPVLLCSLLPEKLESCHLDLEFDETEEVTFSVLGALSVHLTGYYVGNVRRPVDNSDTETFGEDIGDSDSQESSDDDDYEGSFIDDSDVEVFPPSSPDSEVAKKGRTKKKKSDNTKLPGKRLKKKYVMSESEEDDVTSQKNAGSDHVHKEIVESEDDKAPISSLCGNVKDVPEDSKRKMDQFVDCTIENQCEEKKAKKKRKTKKEKSAGNDGSEFVMKPREREADKETKTLPNGIVVEELEIGEPEGKVAVSGKKVSIHYTGKLKKGGKVFDSTDGKDPLKFRLGKGRALDGLDHGVEGMRVGGRRRLIIPPALGYGVDGTDRVPPNSWLIMDVQLVRVH